MALWHSGRLAGLVWQSGSPLTSGGRPMGKIVSTRPPWREGRKKRTPPSSFRVESEGRHTKKLQTQTFLDVINSGSSIQTSKLQTAANARLNAQLTRTHATLRLFRSLLPTSPPVSLRPLAATVIHNEQVRCDGHGPCRGGKGTIPPRDALAAS